MAKLFSSVFKLATNDIANQFALPVKSMTGYVLTHRCANRTKFLNKAVVDEMDIGKDDNLLELGYGRGNGLQFCHEKIQHGKGLVCGIERSGYMEDVTRKRFILEMTETENIRLDSAIDLRNLPYPSDFFHHVYHVDLFYFLHQDRMTDICQEVFRVIRPGGTMVCGMQFSRLKKLTKWGILNETQWDPLRYMMSLEPAGFHDVKLSYHKHPTEGEYELVTARKPEVDESYYDAEERMRELEVEIKREMLAAEMVRSGNPPTKEDIDTVKDTVR